MTVARDDRRHSADGVADQRGKFERDRDRVLYSSAFRRLAGVTQVVHAAEGHIFHNRLTHTLKVAQIGRRLAEHLLRVESKELIEAVGGLDADVVETAALAHDLGHPPFGHIAEAELNDLLEEHHVTDGFEGNAQSFRIVTKVSVRKADHRGLNLTRASLNAILKYPWSRATGGKEQDKWGYYHSERDDFVFARDGLARTDRRKSAEAELMDWADDVAYSVHDVDDFYRASLVPLDQLIAGTDERGRLIEAAVKSDAASQSIQPTARIDATWANSFFDNLKKVLPDEIRGPYQATTQQRATLHTFTSVLIYRYVQAIRLQDAADKPRVAIAPSEEKEVRLLKFLMRYYVFGNPALVGQQYGQRKVVRTLFETLFAAAMRDSPDRGVIPVPFREGLEELDGKKQKPKDEKRERARLVADIISSMTEQQALSLHHRLTGIAPGSVLDLIIR